MKTPTIAAIAAWAVLLSGCDTTSSSTAPLVPTSASRITNGTVDGAGHPGVVLIIMDVAGSPAFRCSGTLVAPKVVVTAGHCTGEPGEFTGMRIFTESDVENGNN